MKSIFSIVLLFICFTSNAQQILIETDEGKAIRLTHLKVDVEVISDIAITTYDMTFYNPNNRVLEGEFKFPLGQNQSVNRFALDINGALREAVVVEQEKARVAFESTIRRKIDPALLEVTEGNNYKARIYPLPARGERRIVLATKQILDNAKNEYYYNFNPIVKEKLKRFEFHMKTIDNGTPPQFQDGKMPVFQHRNGKYSASFAKKSYKVKKGFVVKIPVQENQLHYTDDYFYLKTKLDLPSKTANPINSMTIFWDNSLSQKDKNITKELNLLKAFFTQNPDVNVNFVTFNVDYKSKAFTIKKGNWKALEKEILSLEYDGATAYNVLEEYQDDNDRCIIFTDGLSTLSAKIGSPKKAFVVNSSQVANHNYLAYQAEQNKGIYINLVNQSIKDAINQLNDEPMRFLGTNIDGEIFPKKGSPVSQNFTLTGKSDDLPEEIELYFGYENNVEKTIRLEPKKIRINNNVLEQNWAQNKINILAQDGEAFMDEIIDISKTHQVVSPFTSLLVLDRISDYVRYEIEPPFELRDDYKREMERKIDRRKERYESYLSTITTSYDQLFDWYNLDFKSPKPKKQSGKQSLYISILDSVRVRGVVTDENNEPLIGAPVMVVGQVERGTITDIDGTFSIQALIGEQLEFSYTGYTTIQETITEENYDNMEVALAAGEHLEEVVVVGYGRADKESVSNRLASRVAGIKIQNSATPVKKSNPVYVVDGRVVRKKPNLSPNEIHDLYTLSGEQGVKLFGNKAKDGVLVYITQKGYNKELQSIEDFEDMVEDKLQFSGWNPDMPYLNALDATPKGKQYKKYLALRDEYQNNPSFYVDVADFFSKKDKKTAFKILSNVAEIDLKNYELLRLLAYKYEEYKQWENAVFIYREILKLRPEDLQSYRDLALALEQSGEYQEALDLMYRIMSGDLFERSDRDYFGIEQITLLEMNKLISLHKDQLDITHIDKKYIKDMPVDIRVVIDWNHNDTDMDLWVIDQYKEKCFYGHKKTKIGGLMSDDMTAGFGPEQFILKKSPKGTYKIKVKYYSDSQQKISGPAFLKLTYFKNYGKKNEVQKTKLVRLKERSKVLDVGELIF